LAGCLAMIGEAPVLTDLLVSWPGRFEQALVERIVARLGVERRGADEDRGLASAAIKALRSRKVGIDRFFFDWRGGRIPPDGDYQADACGDLRARLENRQRTLTHPYWDDERPCSMLIEEVESIWSAIADHDDWRPFESKIEAVRKLGDAMTS